MDKQNKREMLDRLKDFDPPAMVNYKGQDIYAARAEAKRNKV